MKNVAEKAIAIALSACLAVTLAASGLFACLLPPTTRILSEHTSNFEGSPYTPEWLTELACATRSFTVDPYGDQGPDAALAALSTLVCQATVECSDPASPTADSWKPLTSVLNLNARMAAPEMMYRMAAVSDSYALDQDAISHLVDCNKLINGVLPWLAFCSIASIAGLGALHLANKRDSRWASVASFACTAAPVVLLAALAVLGTWAALDFNSFFTAFHNVFFPQGNWTFSYDSLLITMYPIDFWIGMAAIWAATTVAACIACLLLGKIIRKKVVND